MLLYMQHSAVLLIGSKYFLSTPEKNRSVVKETFLHTAPLLKALVEVFLFRTCSYSKHSACDLGRQVHSFCTSTHQAVCAQLLACYLSKNLTTSLRQYSGVEIGE